ncbi:glycoside hydrolase family 115 protein [Laetiporus sulphureus 93-53]|uniref:Glycoside hydrolase family 115 protein n=1 Tax=Laetiporus sulphureus 93-53 TaxID=1314785 RepID=A0A165B5I9_9APHY|nr:glycoside hydrolase family 115 protein [Laetiporus sulphureus 93-53]KZT00286.1 glycoside hydrolase family 115 protein [Laetiporus sulphureus 93-53]
MLGCWGACVSLALLALASGVHAIGQATCVSFSPSSASFPIVSDGVAVPILLSEDDWGGVQRAAYDFAMDIHNVTGVMPSLFNVSIPATSANLSLAGTQAIIVGTLGQSSLIDEVVNRTNLDVSSVEGHWEAFMTQEVANPLPGITSAYVMIGADKRGTIYAMYDHSEQIGVSPWYWWADVPTKTHSEVHVDSAGCAHGSPTVQYRGIFLNDEQPALQNWAMARFTNGTGAALTGSPFNHFFYTKLFELLLRLKANYLWPAMWSSAFGVDDLLNQPLANWYGIVMGTSHEEPMMRSIPVEWTLFGIGPWDYSTNAQNIYNFWVVGAERAKPYENVFTVGMRGDGDEPLAGGQDIDLLEEIISDQRQILSNTYPGVNVTTIPQMWCLYKEVLGYYEDGMTVPDDIALMWTDDNYGNIERLPTVSERNRTGGAGVYYHYDYVGDPMDYKWIVSSQLAKTYEQMSLATARNATRIWIVNVGDLKPYEMETEFFITYGWDTSLWDMNNLGSFVELWAQREFALSSEDAATVAGVIANVTRFNSNRKPEMLNGTTYSLWNYREAENKLAMWQATNVSATRIRDSLSGDMLSAYFELVYHPVQASYTLASMWIAAGMNNLRASQAFLSANKYAAVVEELFQQDWELEVEYDTQLEGKWTHMMSQTHVMYAYWQQPQANTKPYISWYQAQKQALAGAMRVAPEGTQAAWPGDNQYQCAQGYSCPNPSLSIDPYLPAGNRYFDLGVGGPVSFNFTATSNVSWLTLSPTEGYISPDAPEQRVFATVDWSQLSSTEAALITFEAYPQGQSAMSLTATLTANYTEVPSDFTGFVEGDGGVSIEAAHAARNTTVEGIMWTELPGYGRTLSGVTPWPRGGDELNFTVGTGPSIEYDFFTFNTYNDTGSIIVTTYVSPSLNSLGPDRPLALGVQVDTDEPQVSYFVPNATPGSLPAQWDGMDGWAANNINSFSMNFTTEPGAHTLTLWMIEPTVVVQKIVIDTGGVQPSYLGPPESIRV